MQVALQSIDILLRTVAAEFLALAFLYIGHGLTQRFFNPSSASVRWSAAILIALAAATFGFHMLAALQQFRLLPAVVLLGFVSLLIHRFVEPVAAFARGASRDLLNLAGLFRAYGRDWRIVPVVVFACFTLLTVAKTLLIPPLGWDSLTYHCVKPAMWVQTGGRLTMDAPGGWSYFSLFVGGGETLTAWSMLPFHSDLLTPFMGAVIWIATGFVLFAAGRTVGLSRWPSLMASFFVLFVPAVHRIAGAGYTEPVLMLYSAGALLAGLCYFSGRNPAYLVLGLTLAGMMAGTESEGLPLAGLTALALVVGVLGDVRSRAAHFKWVLLGGALAFLSVVPWWIHSYQQTGYPLSPVPLKLFGITLGTTVPELAWVQVRPDAVSSPGRELDVLSTLFSFDVPSPRLGPFMLLPVFLFPAGVAVLWRRNRWGALLLATVTASAIIAFYFPGMKVIRLFWAASNARLLLSLVPPTVLGAAVAFNETPKRARLFALLLGLLAAVQAYDGIFWGVDGIVLKVLPFLALGLILLSALAGRMLVTGRVAAACMALLLVPAFLLPALVPFRDRSRAEVYANEGIMTWHYTLRYWSDAARIADDPARPVKVAVTSAPWQNHDSWLDYAFLGRRFQNMLVYVPITASGRIGHFDGTESYQDGARYEVWLCRLQEWGVSYVMSFWPISIEQMWMRQHPEAFEKLSEGKQWGFYRVRKITPGSTPPGATRDPR